MKRFLGLFLCFVLVLPSLPALTTTARAEERVRPSCENGECVDELIVRLEDLGKLYQNKCLPPAGLKKDLETYYAENGISEECWGLVTEINDLEAELQKHQTRLEGKLGCQSSPCEHTGADETLEAQIHSLTKVEQKLSCTEPKKASIKKQCPDDLRCALLAGATGIGGYLVERMIPDKAKIANCHLGDDSCATQLATGFLKSIAIFLESAWDLLAAAGKKVGEKMGQFWDWVRGAEDHTSTAQLTLAKASEDPGIFQMLLHDFPGTMQKVWEALVTSLKEWIKSGILCQKWEGAPHLSECLEPTESFDCVSCKAMVNGLCGVSGYVVAEVLPAFLTGGLVTAAKYGANGATKIAKLFKVSEAGMKAFKESRAVKLALESANKIDDVIRVSKGLRAAKAVASAALGAIGRYLLSPTRRAVKESFLVITSAMKKGSMYVMESRSGKFIAFQGKALKVTGTVLMYPINNPMTDWAYRAGERSFEKLFKLGTPSLASKSGAVAIMLENNKTLEGLVAKLEEAKLHSPKDIARLENELIEALGKNRAKLTLAMAKSEEISLSEMIRNLYPELQYADLARKLPSERVVQSERELLNLLMDLAESPRKEQLIREFQLHRSSPARKGAVKISRTFDKTEVIGNASLGDEERLKKIFETLKIDGDKLPPKLREEMVLSLKSAREFGTGSVYHTTSQELLGQLRILKKGGFTTDQADELLRSGLVGRVRPEDTFPALSRVAVDEVDATSLAAMLRNDDYADVLEKFGADDQQKVARALKHLENQGMKPDEIADLFDDFEDSFMKIVSATDKDSHGVAYLAEIIHKNRKAGLADEAIMRKIQTALKECK